LKQINVLLAIIVSTLVAGILSKMPLNEIMSTFINGMGGNSETALSYILLGAFAATMAHSGFTNKLSESISKIIMGNKWGLLLVITLIAMASQNIIPIHIAFIPIVIPSLLKIMNNLQIDRRGVASALTFGLKMPYITIPVGFGLIFHNLIADNLIQNGVLIQRADIWKYTVILGIGMFVALLISLLISYRKPRIYEDRDISLSSLEDVECSNYTIGVIIISAVLTFVVQLLTHSLPLGALVGLGIIFTFKVLHHERDS
jgi:predicted histidine transporter YuiF (NhaC family)